ncbi:DUF438 domain-containing protein [Anaerosinus massiliensis]|uniref:DUF438 domain-containing protein n=1 Tax=Massilibacillus massiliensis TaxID=1806837 RepID=UPI000A73DEBC|nr:DUF438 domain-containing protein [Massilibacillus massiliensis]
MSAEINNREYRQHVLKELLSQLHDGKDVEEIKAKFIAVFGNVSADEIARAEQAIMDQGVPVTEVQRLCDIHAAAFEGLIAESHHNNFLQIPGHPVHTLKRENEAIAKLAGELQVQINRIPDGDAEKILEEGLIKLAEIDRHYVKKENLFFPYMEQHGITAPPKVMWGKHDEIRDLLKEIKTKIQTDGADSLKGQIKELLDKVIEMIFKEENILVPMLLENFTQDEWKVIADESFDLGHCLIDEVPVWNPTIEKNPQLPIQERTMANGVTLPTGVLKMEELVGMLNNLPVDITFVDKDDTVKYFSQGAERVFPRTKAIIGRKVSNCHPPASVHIVEKLIEDFKAGRKNREDFWIHMGEKYILICYFAVRNETGAYLGVLEVTQNIQPIQMIEGEKRLATD